MGLPGIVPNVIRRENRLMDENDVKKLLGIEDFRHLSK